MGKWEGYRHPFKSFIINPKETVAKDDLRDEVKQATVKYLEEGNEIEYIPDGPAAKTPSVGLTDWGWEINSGMGDIYEEADQMTNLETQWSAQLSEGDL